MLRALVLAGVCIIVVAGCGGGSTTYTAAATAPCLEKNGFTDVTTNPAKVGFIASVAEHGGLYAKSPGGNALTIAFTADEKDAAETEVSYRKHAPPSLRPHMSDVMESKANAVLVWTVSASPQELSAALACLRSG